MTTRPDYSCIALVDLSYLFTRNYRGAGLKAPPNAGALRTLEDLKGIRDDVDHVILALDAPPYLRRDRFEDYKAHREAPPQEEVLQKRALIEELKRLGYVTARVKGYEADDIIATLSRIYSEWCPEVRIYGPDKDVAQCIRANVVQIIPSSGKRQTYRRDAKKCVEEFGALPSQMPLWQAMVGDGADGVPGVKGVGPAKATTVIRELTSQNRPVTLEGLANLLAEQKAPTKELQAVANDWNSLKLSLDLVTLDPNVPLDADALLVPRAPEPDAEDTPDDIDLFNFEGNATPPAAEGVPDDAIPLDEPAPTPPSRPQPRIGADPNAEAILREAQRQREAAAQAPASAPPAPASAPPAASRAAMAAEQARSEAEQQYVVQGRETVINAATGRGVCQAHSNEYAIQIAAALNAAPSRSEAAAPPAAALVAPPRVPANDTPPAVIGSGRGQVSATALAKAAELGMVNTRLQPLDLTAAVTLAKYLHGSGRYGNHDTVQGLFAVIHRGVELGLDVGTALAGFHIIQGKPAMSADLIRALAKRHPDCAYFYEESSDETQSTWVTRNRRHPPGVVQRLTYTIEEAREVPDLWKKDRHGGPSMWEKRPKQMLSKTASSILARREYEEQTLGMCCPEELGTVIATTGVAA
jgi:5'-3' exonuclease